MEAISIASDPHLYFQVGKIKISEGMKSLQDLVEWYKDNLTPESAGRVNEIMAFLQSLQLRVVQGIESLAQLRGAHISSNFNTTDLRQEITQIRQQNKETEMVMNPNIENTSSAKRRKLKSKVWEDFTKDKGIDGKEWAKCKHCKKDFVGSSKSGTTHLKNHLKSCLGLRNPGGVADKAKEKTVIDPELNGSDLMQKLIKYGLKGIRNDIVYQQEKDKLRGYLDKLPCRFNLTIQREYYDVWSMKIWFIDDSWQLKDRIIDLGTDIDDEIVMSSLVDWNIDKKICSMIRDSSFFKEEDSFFKEEDSFFKEEEEEDIYNWFNERGSLSFIGIWLSSFLQRICIQIGTSIDNLAEISRYDISTKLNKLTAYVRTNENKFRSAIEKAVSKGKTVTSERVPSSWMDGVDDKVDEDVLEWVMGYKEAFCELEDIDPHFKSINLIKEDWDEVTLLYTGWKMVRRCWEIVRDQT